MLAEQLSHRTVFVIAALSLLGLASCGESDDGPAPTTTTTTTTTWAATTSSSPTSTTSTTTAPQPTLSRGDSGDGVLAVQRRLDALGYWLEDPDGVFGDSTHHAVVALQKVIGVERNGVVDDVTRAAIDRGDRPMPRSAVGRVVEIDLDRQVLLVVHDGAVEVALDTSTGRVRGTTPVGKWQVFREIDGPHWSRLGLLYRPKYFRGGVAMHGYTSVPPRPASHGCVRVTYPAMDMIWNRNLVPIGTDVWVY